ncbi:hypothetical protein HYFRA_00011643 [Hymenoscyphus fraxineus]|uniref:NAD-dependent epimerase/dehydratase domain-containing protein n=1 Tax=Hymenoscyphus fraxineus TaxID=746836 RepID=A0A9N9PJG1_9HELO|nr:hypothetical protein HYFRA_00011643 [Hymenoscyphus fraxineus]
MSKNILLTGANGFIGSHILSLLLTSHHHILAIVRSPSKATKLTLNFTSHPQSANLELGIVPDITVPGAFASVIESAQASRPLDIVIHTASPFLYRVVENNIEFLDPAIKGTLEILRAVKEGAGSVKRVVVTSSCAAVIDFDADVVQVPRKVYTEEDWNPRTWEEALGGSPNAGYQASKKFAEKAEGGYRRSDVDVFPAWDFLDTEKPAFDLVTLAPPMVYGPLRHSVESIKDLNQSNGRIYNLFINSTQEAPEPPNGLHLYVDVRDLAKAHLLAALTPSASNSRLLICVGSVSSQEISDLLRSNIPELETRTPRGNPGMRGLDENAYGASSGKAERVLGLRYRGKEETFVELARQLLGIEREEVV